MFETGESSKPTAENYLGQAKKSDKLLGFRLYEARVDGELVISTGAFPESEKSKEKRAKSKKKATASSKRPAKDRVSEGASKKKAVSKKKASKKKRSKA